MPSVHVIVPSCNMELVHVMNYWSACYKLDQCYIDLVHIGKCRHMVQVLSHSQGWLCSHEVSEWNWCGSKQAGLAYQHERAGRVIGMSNDG